MSCVSCPVDLETTIGFQSFCCKKYFCGDCFYKRSGRCKDTGCREVHFKCICERVSNVPSHVLNFIALAHGE